MTRGELKSRRERENTYSVLAPAFCFLTACAASMLILGGAGCGDDGTDVPVRLNILTSAVTLNVTEEDAAGVQLDIALSLAGTDTASLVATGDVRLGTVDDAGTASGSIDVSLNGATPVAVYVFGVDDADYADDTGETITITYAGANNSPLDVTVNIADNDSLNMSVSPATLSVTEENAAGVQLDIALDGPGTGTASLVATGDVRLNTVDDAGTASGSVNVSLNGTTPVTVYVFGVDDADDIDDAGETITITYAGADNSPLDVTVNITDNDGLNISASPATLSVTEENAAGVQLDIALDGPGTGNASLVATGDVRLGTVDDAGTASASINVSLNGTTPVTVYVFGVDDVNYFDDTGETITITYTGAGNSPFDVTVNITDNDNANNVARAADLLSNPAVREGLCVHIGCGDGGLTLALYEYDEGRHLVQGITDNQADLAAARPAIQGAGKYGPCSVILAALDGLLPYAPHSVNTIVVDNFPAKEAAGVSADDIVAILAPYGSAFLEGGPGSVAGATVETLADGWVRVEKLYPAGMDEWRQGGSGVGGYDATMSNISKDQLAGPPSALRWIAGDRWTNDNGWGGIQIVSANGRVFYKHKLETNVTYGYGDIAPGWRITGRDAFNGLKLWEKIVPLDPEPYGITGRLAAVGDSLFIRGEEWDAATGQVTGAAVFDSMNWTYAHEPGLDPMWVRVRGKATVVDFATGTQLWQRVGGGGYRGCVGEGKLFQRTYDSPPTLMCIDLSTFNQDWLVDCTGDPEYIFYRDGIIFFRNGGDPHRNVARSAADGAKLWEYSYPVAAHGGEAGLFFLGGLCWVHAGLDPVNYPGRGETYRGLDPVTGTVAAVVFMDEKVKHRCSEPKATENYIMSGGMNFLDPNAQQMYGVYAARSACSFGYMPANGMLYNGPTVCQCFGHLRGTMAVAADTVDSWVDMRGRSGPGDVQGPAWGTSGSVVPAASDWPTFRHDPLRSSVTDVSVSETLSQSWAAQVGGDVTAPVVAGGYVFAGDITGHRVVALDGGTGAEVWSYTTGGPVDTPPTVAGGYVIFGGRDGWICCLNSDTGELVWKFRAAPENKRIVSRGQLESVWPMNGTVLVMNGKAYFSAGRHDEVDGGIFLFCLDLATGAVQWEHQVQRANLLLQCNRGDIDNEQNDILTSDGLTIYMYRKFFNVSDGLRAAARTGYYLKGSTPGWLCDIAKRPYTWKHQMQCHRKLKSSSGSTRFQGSFMSYNVGISRATVVNNDEKKIRYGASSGSIDWEADILAGSCPKGLAVTAGKAFVSGIPVELAPGTGEVKVYSIADGTLLNTVALPYAAKFDSIAAIPGKIFVSTQDGRIVCLSE